MNRKRRTVLLVCEYGTLNGGERSLLAAIDQLSTDEFRLVALAPAEGGLAESLAARNIEVRSLELYGSTGVRIELQRVRGQLATHIAEVRPDLIHANSVSTSRWTGPVASQAAVPSVGHLRDIAKLSRQAIADIGLNSRLLAVSAATRAAFVHQGLPAENIHVAFNGVDPIEFCPRDRTGRLHDELGLPPGAPLILTIGQIGIRKGLDVLLDAAAEVQRRHPQTHWLIVGRRHSRKDEAVTFEHELHQQAAQPELAGHVHFLDERSDVPILLNEATLIVHAARQEPLGRVLLEAAASGCAIVATEVGGTAEIFPAGLAAAVLVPPDAPSTLARSIDSLLADAPRRKSLGGAARERALTEFDVAATTNRLVEHYTDCSAVT